MRPNSVPHTHDTVCVQTTRSETAGEDEEEFDAYAEGVLVGEAET